MGIVRRLRNLVGFGQLIKDYGAVSDSRRAGVRVRIFAALHEQDGPCMVIHDSNQGWGSFSSRWMVLDRDGMAKLDAVLHDALARADGDATVGPPDTPPQMTLRDAD